MSSGISVIEKIVCVLLLLMVPHLCHAQRDAVDKTTDVLCLAPALTGACVAWAKEDWDGMKQLGLSAATGIAANYLLEAAITKDRPDGTGHHAFPSTHTMAAFTGATFLTRRYGWKWGVPAYVVSSYVAWGRCYARKHDAWDVLGGAALGTVSACLFTTSFAKDKNLTVAPVAWGNGAGVYVSMCL